MTSEEILNNIFNELKIRKIPYKYNDLDTKIYITGTEYSLEFNECTEPWRCFLMKGNDVVRKGNPTSVIMLLGYLYHTNKNDNF